MWENVLDIWRAFKASGSRQIFVERRKTWRIYSKIVLQACRKTGESRVMTAVNMGPGGLRLESDVPLKKNEVIRLRVAEVPDGTQPSARVLWCRRKRDHSLYEAGLAFTLATVRNRKALERFLLEDCKLLLHYNVDQRTETRYQSHLHAVCEVLESEAVRYDRLPVVVEDLSVGGALVLSEQKLDRGIEVNLQMPLITKARPIHCQGTVVRQAGIADQQYHKLGVHFTAMEPAHRTALMSFLSTMLRK